MVCIEDVQVGDEVWAYNPETGETELKEVLNVWIKETDEILHVSTSDGETIDTTTNHPFYVENNGWVAAGDLEIGDTLVTADGDEVEVSDIEFEKLDEPIIVYNLEVEDFHTYFVGEYGLLVHNYGGKDDKLALGLSDYLDDFASSNNAHTWKDFADPTNWQSGVLEELNNPNIEVIFNLDGIDNVWASITRAARGGGGATDWELLQIKQMPEIWERITWFLKGNVAPNPFM